MKFASIVSAMVLLLVLSGCRKEPVDLSQTQFPSGDLRTKVELLRSRDHKGGRVRVVRLSDDKTTVTGAEIEYENGVTEFEEYRVDGSLREITGFYPLAGKSNKRTPSRSVLYDRDGKTVLFERTMRTDGTTERLNRSRSDGGFEIETFYPDGKTAQTRTVVSRFKDVLLEETFRANGKLETQRRRLDYSDYEIVEFRENGRRSSVTTGGSNRWSPIEKIVFAADGVMVEMKIRYTSSSVDVEYRRSDGTLAEKRSYSQYGSVTVTVCGADGKPQFRQEWRGSSSAEWTDATGYKLREIDELNSDGVVTKEIELYDDGVTVKKVRVTDGGNYYSGTYRYFRPDGTLEKEEVKEDYDKVKETKEFKQEEGIKEKLPDNYFKLPERVQPKLLSVMPESEPYNPYGEGYPYDEYGMPLNPDGSPIDPANPSNGGYPNGYPFDGSPTPTPIPIPDLSIPNIPVPSPKIP